MGVDTYMAMTYKVLLPSKCFNNPHTTVHLSITYIIIRYIRRIGIKGANQAKGRNGWRLFFEEALFWIRMIELF